MGLRKVLGTDENQLRKHLDQLAELDIIEQYSAKPRAVNQPVERRKKNESSYVIVPCWDNPLDLLEEAYEKDSATPGRPLMQSLEGILDDEDEDPPFLLSSVQAWFSNLCTSEVGHSIDYSNHYYSYLAG